MHVTVTPGIVMELCILLEETPATWREKGPLSCRTAHQHSGDGGGKRSGPGLPLSAPSAKCSGFPWSKGRVQLFGPRGVRGFVWSWGNLFYGIKPGRYLVLE